MRDTRRMTTDKMVKKQSGELVSGTQNRLVWADAIRVIAIFLVVYVHQLSLLPPLTFATLFEWIPQLYALIGVPLFVVLSGSLLLPKKESLTIFFTKRVRAVLLPWVFWVFVYSVIGVLFLNESFGSILEFAHYEYVLFFSRFWFLPLIFSLYLLTPIVRIFVQYATKQILMYCMLLWFFVIVCLPVASLIFGGSNVPDTSLLFFTLQYVGVFVLGYVLVVRNVYTLSVFVWTCILLTSVVLTTVATFFNSLPLYPHIDRTFSSIFSPTFLPGAVAVFMILYLKLRRVKTLGKRADFLLVEMSKSVLGVYLVHEIIQESLVNFLPIYNSVFSITPAFIGIPFRAVIVFLLSFAVIFFMRRVTVLRIFA